MDKSIYKKLAWTNIKKNKSIFFPFGLSCGTMVGIFYTLLSISNQASDSIFYGGQTMDSILSLGVWVCGIFSVIVIFYTNGFLFKRRNKEFGLYSLLGMGKKHICKILFWEVIITSFIGLIGGLLGGLLFSRMMFLILLNLLQLPTSFEFGLSMESVLKTLLIFTSIFLVNILSNNLNIRRLKPIELLQGTNVGEREPKGQWLRAIGGGICLFMGYYIAIRTENPIQALSAFFLAVILVIVGTYLLFISGSIAILKILKRNKKYYYHKTHFITVSGMMYRMKQNAVGLATICILSTAVIVVFSTTVSLYIGIEDVLANRYPKDVMTTYIYEPEEDAKNNLTYNYDRQLIVDSVRNHALRHDLEASDIEAYYSFSSFGEINGEIFTPGYLVSNESALLTVMTLEDYKSLQSEDIDVPKLRDNYIHMISSDPAYNAMESLTFGNKTYKISPYLQSMELKYDLIRKMSDTLNSNYILILVDGLDNLALLRDSLINVGNSQNYGIPPIIYNYNFDLSGNIQNKGDFINKLRDALNEADIPHVAAVESIFTARQDFIAVYGTLFFIGIFIGVLFLLATGLIIYYKQISEGYEDRDRFIIMQKVGMSKDEVKKVIKDQILTIFYLPILLAVVHIVFAFDIIKKILAILYLTNVSLFAVCTLGTVLIFIIIYGLVYKSTAKTYYRIVN